MASPLNHAPEQGVLKPGKMLYQYIDVYPIRSDMAGATAPTRAERNLMT